MSPQLDVRSTGEQTSKDSVKRIFTDNVILEVPIVSTGPNGQPVIDLDSGLARCWESATTHGSSESQRS